ncbi:related to TRM44 - tRNA(Ser) Um(44) 2'-O-methyltransferase [Ustilago trichophora]|uniref:tRNA (uracil-O(2)-)-methyltransferase n=1 Tax=Ustilago trichophora TaxID=86804 RepID=A0A5C3DW62_9BASI|nr:related to TRM44 - tRNA(Ser) Um(44) 2'-O-methyltransferase [Ustilago trichophora]
MSSSTDAECSTSISARSNSSIQNGAPKRTTTQHQQLPPRPKLNPAYPSAESPVAPSCSSANNDDATRLPFALSGLLKSTGEEKMEEYAWISVITAPAYAPMTSWLAVMQSLIRHPERNSSNILRADVVSESEPSQAEQQGWRKQWTIRRALLPRRPNLDWRMEQDCSLYYKYQRGGEGHEEEDEDVAEAVVIYTPLIGTLSHPKMEQEQVEVMGQPPQRETSIPFYHPKVRALAFHFRLSSPSSSPSASSDTNTMFGSLGISLIPFPQTPSNRSKNEAEASEGAYPPTHRLSRVALSLITTLHMHTWGHLHSYQKRVHHDTVVPRELYQDLYLELKRKYAGELISNWAEATDPTKHVFEEMGIAAFLISLWSLTYKGKDKEQGEGEEWKNKVKFVDVGCGNGLLTYILSREGFRGVGLDLRSRKSWTAYTSNGAQLSEWTFNPSTLVQPPSSTDSSSCSSIWTGAWLLGNHADELTPWLPVLATHHTAAGFINLPCCYFSLDGTRAFPLLLKGGREVSRNEQYLAYVGELHKRFGWQVDLEPLRIPSTKNWCFVGRTRIETEAGEEGLKQKVKDAVEQAMASGWAARACSK